MLPFCTVCCVTVILKKVACVYFVGYVRGSPLEVFYMALCAVNLAEASVGTLAVYVASEIYALAAIVVYLYAPACCQLIPVCILILWTCLIVESLAILASLFWRYFPEISFIYIFG